MARSNTYSVEATTKFLNNLNATSTTIPNFGHQRRFASQKQTSRKGVFTTNTLPHRMKRELRNNCSIRQQADVIRYISTKNAAESEENNPPTDKLYFQNVFTPDVHSTPIYQIRNKAHSIPKNASMSTSFNTKQSGVCQSNHYLNDYELFKSSTAHRDTVPTVSKKIDTESHHITTFNIGTSTIGSESKIIKRRGIRGVSWILRLALKDTSIGRIYRTQIGWVILILVIFILIAGLLVHFSSNFTTFHMVSFTNLTNAPPKFILDIVNSTNDTTTERSTTYHPYSAEMNDAIMSNNLYEQNDVPSTSVEVFTYEVENHTTFNIVENNKTDNIIRDGNSKYKSKMADFTNQLLDYCKGCRKILDVCIAVADSGIPMCRPAADIGDPTGCGGLCALEIEACHLLDHKHSIYTCRPLETLQLCKSDEWRCKNYLCVPGVKRCDGHINCYDRSDETDCTCNLAKNFHCGNNTSCLENKRRCDGVVDCWDGSDELNCTAACPEDQFACTNGECIQRTLFCDGLADCRDGSDEPIGCGGSCRRHEFKCSNKRCISKWRVCNGTDNCGDMSDELSCPHVKLPS